MMYGHRTYGEIRSVVLVDFERSGDFEVVCFCSTATCQVLQRESTDQVPALTISPPPKTAAVRTQRALARSEGDLLRLDRESSGSAILQHHISIPSDTTTRSASPNPPSEEQRLRQWCDNHWSAWTDFQEAGYMAAVAPSSPYDRNRVPY
jgi:hypothetical protein